MTGTITKKKSILNPKNLYGNITVLSPDNIFMFRANEKKLEFYVKNNLAERINDVTYRLTFVPKGLGHGDETLSPPRKNICVVSGTSEELTRHHIVPRFFRRLLPERYKHSYKLIVLVNRLSHNDYTIEEVKFLDVLAEKYGTTKASYILRENSDKIHAKKIARILLNHKDRFVREEQLISKQKQFKELSGLEPTEENIMLIANQELISPFDIFANELFGKITDLDEFERLWFNHFVETMRPRFLPQDLIDKFGILNN